MYQLYERGFIRSLDDPLNKFCPQFSIDNPFTADNITLRQIITSVSHKNMNMIKSTNHNFLRCMLHALQVIISVCIHVIVMSHCLTLRHLQ